MDVPRAWQGRCVRLNFKGVMQIADIWLNGVHVGGHVGGYTGFSVDLTKQLKFGAQNLIVVKVDDTLSPYIAPPVEINVPAYGGIYRTVSLTVLDPVHIPENGVWVTWEKRDKDATVTIHGSLRSQSSTSSYAKVEYRILDGDGAVQAQTQSEARLKAGEEQELSPATALYRILASGLRTHLIYIYCKPRCGMETEWSIAYHSFWYPLYGPRSGAGISADRGTHQPARNESAAGLRFLGDAVPEAVGVKDVRLMKQMGVNFVRTSHYQDPAVLDM